MPFQYSGSRMTVAPVCAPRAIDTAERSPVRLRNDEPSEIARMKRRAGRAATGCQANVARDAPGAGRGPIGSGGASGPPKGGRGRTGPGSSPGGAATATGAGPARPSATRRMRSERRGTRERGFPARGAPGTRFGALVLLGLLVLLQRELRV